MVRSGKLVDFQNNIWFLVNYEFRITNYEFQCRMSNYELRDLMLNGELRITGFNVVIRNF